MLFISGYAGDAVVPVGNGVEVLHKPFTSEVLLARVEKIVSKESIIQAVANWGEELTPNAIEVYVSRLRAKLDTAGVKIRTVRGFGYMLEEFKESRADQ